MRKCDIWFPFYIGDYLADTMHLTTIQHGAYILLLLSYYKNQGPLPDDDTQLASITKLSHSDWTATRSIVANFFKIEAGRWIHSRADTEIAIRQKRQLAAREGAAKTNTKRWGSQCESQCDTHSGRQNVANHSHSTDVNKKANFSEVPPMTRTAFNTLAELRCIPVDCADYFWNEWDSRNWLDRNGKVLARVEPALLNFAKNWRQNGELKRSREFFPKAPSYNGPNLG